MVALMEKAEAEVEATSTAQIITTTTLITHLLMREKLMLLVMVGAEELETSTTDPLQEYLMLMRVVLSIKAEEEALTMAITITTTILKVQGTDQFITELMIKVMEVTITMTTTTKVVKAEEDSTINITNNISREI